MLRIIEKVILKLEKKISTPRISIESQIFYFIVGTIIFQLVLSHIPVLRFIKTFVGKTV